MSAEQLSRSATAAGSLAAPSPADAVETGPDDRFRHLGGAARLPHRSQLRRNLKRFLIGNRLNLVGLVIVVVFLVCAILGELIAPSDPYADDISGAKLLAPSWSHPMGTDEIGRDVFSRVIVGARTSLKVAFVVLSFAVLFGTLVGAVAGFNGGLVDEILMRFTDLFLAFPAFVLAIAIAATLGRSLTYTMIALSAVFWPWYARLVRAQVLSIRERDFVAAGRSLGMTSSRLLVRHILPNAVSVVIIQVTLDVGYAILATSGLSFIGLGAQPPTPEWGTMLTDARNYFREAWWYTTFPGLALTLTVLAFNLLGDGLQEALDPRSGRH
jgi:peptide/nickel transport system permease protein